MTFRTFRGKGRNKNHLQGMPRKGKEQGQPSHVEERERARTTFRKFRGTRRSKDNIKNMWRKLREQGQS